MLKVGGMALERVARFEQVNAHFLLHELTNTTPACDVFYCTYII